MYVTIQRKSSTTPSYSAFDYLCPAERDANQFAPASFLGEAQIRASNCGGDE
jgi:hypothetical protein